MLLNLGTAGLSWPSSFSLMRTPKIYSDFLLRVGGKNIYGEPNYILHWGGDPVRRLAVPDSLIAPYLNSWCLAEWRPRQEFGPERDWLAEAGPYPLQGGYIPLQVFANCHPDSEALNLNVLAMMMHFIHKARAASLADQLRHMKDRNAAGELAQRNQIADLLADAVPAFNAAEAANTSPGGTSLSKKIEQLERNLKRGNWLARMPKGANSLQSLPAR